MNKGIVPPLDKIPLPDKSDTLLLTGIMSLFYGLYQYNPPAAYVVIGLLLIVISSIAAKPFNKKGNQG